MKDEIQLSRRNLLRGSILGGGSAFAFLSSIRAWGLTDVCSTTPPQTEGPFYPVKDQVDKDWDLTVVGNKTARALGQVIYIRGTVQDEQCRPVPKALVEIWQACASGKYNHPGDDNPAALDPNFQYWGRIVTDANGQYLFKTIKPGAYPADATWMRPPHVHFKVHRRGFNELTTQLYFSGESLNDTDKILLAVPKDERERVLVPFASSPTGLEFESGSLLGIFDITLVAVR